MINDHYIHFILHKRKKIENLNSTKLNTQLKNIDNLTSIQNLYNLQLITKFGFGFE